MFGKLFGKKKQPEAKPAEPAQPTADQEAARREAAAQEAAAQEAAAQEAAAREAAAREAAAQEAAAREAAAREAAAQEAAAQEAAAREAAAREAAAQEAAAQEAAAQDAARQAAATAAAQPETQPAAASFGRQPEFRLSEIVVSEEALAAVETDPGALANEIVASVNELLNRGMFLTSELPQNAVCAYYVNFYSLQMKNGGHGRFLANSRGRQIVRDAVEMGLERIGAPGYADVFRAFRAWVAANPEKAEAQAELTKGGYPELQTLDRHFEALSQQADLTGAMARWVAGLPETRTTPASELPQVLEKMGALNPKREPRAVAARVNAIARWLDDPLHFSVGYAAAQKQPIGVAFRIAAGVYIPVDGETQLCWVVEESGLGRCIAHGSDMGMTLYKYVDPIAEGALPQIGDRIGFVARDQLESAARAVHGGAWAPAIDLLLRKAGADANRIAVSFCAVDGADQGADQHRFLVVAGVQPYYAVVRQDVAALIDAKSETRAELARVSREEIDAHAQSVAAIRD